MWLYDEAIAFILRDAGGKLGRIFEKLGHVRDATAGATINQAAC